MQEGIALQLDKSSTMQINQQIQMQLKFQILNGEIALGEKLPSVREMAKTLNVNRHTVSKAYKELEDEDLIVIKGSIGTFVSESINPIKTKDYHLLNKLAESNLNAAINLGYSKDEYMAAINNIRLFEKQSLLKGLFVECNATALDHYLESIQKSVSIDVSGCLLDQIESGSYSKLDLSQYDLIMTTMGHYPRLKNLVGGEKLFALNFGPYLKVLKEIQELPTSFKLGFVCINETGAIGLMQVLRDLGIQQSKLHYANLGDRMQLMNLIETVDALIISKYAYEEDREYFDKIPHPKIEYTNKLQETSIVMLNEIIQQLKQNRT